MAIDQVQLPVGRCGDIHGMTAAELVLRAPGKAPAVVAVILIGPRLSQPDEIKGLIEVPGQEHAEAHAKPAKRLECGNVPPGGRAGAAAGLGGGNLSVDPWEVLRLERVGVLGEVAARHEGLGTPCRAARIHAFRGRATAREERHSREGVPYQPREQFGLVGVQFGLRSPFGLEQHPQKCFGRTGTACHARCSKK